MRKVFILVFPVMVFLCAHAYAGDFTDNVDGTVTDNITGLMWQQEDASMAMTWEGALSYCEGLTLAGHGDWRLPNIKELESITDDTVYNPAIETAYFPGTGASDYWSSTTYAFNASLAWDVYFGSGHVYYGNKTDDYDVRCVR